MEILDVVDEQDVVTGQENRTEIYACQLPHRIVHILPFDRSDRMLLQRRSLSRSFMPGAWSTGVGGHVRAGESYEEAARREAREELGYELPLELLGKDRYVDEANPELIKFLTTYRCHYEGPLSPNPEEVDSVCYFSLEEIQHLITTKAPFHPELLFILGKYYRLAAKV